MSSAAIKAARKAALAQVVSGKRNYVHKEAVDVYDEVDDETFKSIHRERMNRDDFVEEDSKDATGYADNGMEDWDRDSSDSEDRPAPKKAKASTSKLPKSNSTTSLKKKPKIIIPEGANPFLKPGQTSFKDEPSAIVEDDFMAGLLGDLDEKVITTTTTGSSNVKPIISRAAPIKTQAVRKSHGSTSEHPRTSLASSSSAILADTSVIMASSDGVAGTGGSITETDDFFGDMEFGGTGAGDDDDIEMKEEEDENGFQIKEDGPKTIKPVKRRPLANGALKPQLPTPKIEPMEIDESLSLPPPPPSFPSLTTSKPSSKPKGTDWRRATAGLVSAAPIIIHDEEEVDEDGINALPVPESLKNKNKKGPIKQTPNVKAVLDDGSLPFWWFDYIEPVPGVLFLVGKVKVKGDEDSKKWVSCCVTVSGIKRKLYILPRERAQDMDGEELDDDGPPEFDDVEADFTDAASERWKAKNVECTQDFVQKKYSFDIPGIPRQESNWLEATTDFPLKGKHDIPMDASGGTFSHVFGTNTTAFEMFVLDHKIMGPCWLNIQNAKVSDKNISWTKLEVEASTSDISVFSQDDPGLPKSTPTLTIMSLSTRTVVELKENKKQIVIASARVWADNDLDDITPLEKQPSSATTIVRRLVGPFPKGFEGVARNHKTITAVHTEKELLIRVLALIHAADPDVIIGHDLLAGELDVLLHRMREHKIENWSQVGRFRRTNWPAKPASSKFVASHNADLVNGRLRCDLTSDGSKSIIDSVSYSLTEMCDHYLKIDREDMDPEDTALHFDEQRSSTDRLIKLTLHCEADCYFQMAIASAVQALPLTRQLTNLAGNSWNKTLGGNRAERNEYILLHRFTEKGYVCPDKLSHKEKEAKDKAAEAKKIADAKAEGVDEEDIKQELIVRKKEKFKGGLVFDPKRGLWDSYVLVMDFNSLYPSIIQEYDIDFSTIDWTEWSEKDAEGLEAMPDRPPCEGEPQGILPQLIAYLVSRRVKVKGLIKDLARDPKAKGSPAGKAKYRQYDITQKALKLTANSMYGCLGYEYGRFYARPLAALTTFKGREILTRTKAEAEALSLDVIYGDTDSVMINTNETDYAAAVKIGNEFKKSINEKYKKLEIDTDAVFKRMLLLNKKKYAALLQDEDGNLTKEVKGLDMKRREYSAISKAASNYVLDQILSGESTELVVEQIHDYLTDFGENVRGGKVPLEEFIIFMRLGKDAKSYPDGKSKPHVQVALRMQARGQSAKAGDVIPYIFCLPDTGIPALSGKAANAYHPDEIKKQGSTLQVDYAVYLAGQILPPLVRLCEHIEGTEKARLSECLGIESRSAAIADAPERDWKTLQSQQSDAERFKDAEPFHFRCRVCSTESDFTGLASTSTAPFTPYGLRCINSDCNAEISLGSLSVQLDILCRQFITKFYEQWLVCDDQSCANRTRMMSVYGKRCLVQDCRGQMHFEYSDSQLYNQLLFLDGLLDSDASLAKAASGRQDDVRILGESNKAAISALRSIVSTHLAKNGRRFVNMAGLFSFVSL